MRKYPLKISDFLTSEDVAAGRIYAKMPYEDYVCFVNEAFFSGFELGSCETVEEFKSITVWERVKLYFMAMKMMEELYADTPSKARGKGKNQNT